MTIDLSKVKSPKINVSSIDFNLLKRVFIYTFIFGFISHLAICVSPVFSHDALLVHQNDYIHQISIGRFLQPLYLNIRGDIAIPFVIVVLSMVYLSMSMYLIVKMLDFKSNKQIALLCGLFATCHVLVLANATYTPWSDIFMLSMFLNMLALYLTINYKYGFIVGSILIFISCGLYQAYIQAFLALALILLIKNILNGEKTKTIILRGVLYIITLGMGLGLYYIATLYVPNLCGIDLSTAYNGVSDVGVKTFSGFIDLTGQTYEKWFKNFFYNHTFSSVVITVVKFAFVIIALLSLIAVVIKRKIKIVNLVLMLIFIGILPVAMNVTNILTKGISHDLMTYTNVFVYVFCFAIFAFCPKFDNYFNLKKVKISHIGIIVLTASIIFTNCIYANQVYLQKYLQSESTFSTMTRVIEEMEETPGYVVGQTPVVLIGSLNDVNLARPLEGFEEAKGLGASIAFSTTYYTTYERYFRYIMGYPINLVDATPVGYGFNDSVARGGIVERFSQYDEVKMMPAFPYEGSVMMLDGYLIVKLGNI